MHETWGMVDLYGVDGRLWLLCERSLGGAGWAREYKNDGVVEG